MELLDIFGLFLMTLIIFSIFITSFYIYVYMSHSLDKDYSGSWIGRLLIITGMSSVNLLLVLFELDFLCHYKSKNLDFGFNFDLDRIWVPTIYFCAFLSISQFFFIQYYRNAQPKSIFRKLLWASFVTFWPVAIYSLLTIKFFFAQSFSQFSVYVMIADEKSLIASEESSGMMKSSDVFKQSLNIAIKPSLMLVSPFLLLCSLAFSIFGGAGLAYYPISLIKAYLHRPKEITAEDLVFQKNALKEDSKRLIEKAKEVYDFKRDLILNPDIDKKELKIKNKIINRTATDLISDVLTFEDAFHTYKSSQNYTNHNPLYYLGCLTVGIFGLILASLLFIDITLSLMKKNLIMDGLFMFIKKISPIYCFVIFFMIGVYVSIAVTKGSYKLSKMIFYIFQAFPIKGNRTWTDAFLLNNIVVIMSIIGYLLMLERTCPVFFSYLSFSLFAKTVMRNPIMLLFYKYKIIRFLYLFAFLIAVFTSMIFHSSKELLFKSSEDMKREYNKKKADYQALNKEIK